MLDIFKMITNIKSMWVSKRLLWFTEEFYASGTNIGEWYKTTHSMHNTLAVVGLLYIMTSKFKIARDHFLPYREIVNLEIYTVSTSLVYVHVCTWHFLHFMCKEGYPKTNGFEMNKYRSEILLSIHLVLGFFQLHFRTF